MVFFYFNKNQIFKPDQAKQKALQNITANYTTPASLKSYLITKQIPSDPSNWCLTGMAFLPPLPRLFEASESPEYTQVPGNSFSLLFWTINAEKTGLIQRCLKEDTQVPQDSEVIEMENG